MKKATARGILAGITFANVTRVTDRQGNPVITTFRVHHNTEAVVPWRLIADALRRLRYPPVTILRYSGAVDVYETAPLCARPRRRPRSRRPVSPSFSTARPR